MDETAISPQTSHKLRKNLETAVWRTKTAQTADSPQQIDDTVSRCFSVVSHYPVHGISIGEGKTHTFEEEVKVS